MNSDAERAVVLLRDVCREMLQELEDINRRLEDIDSEMKELQGLIERTSAISSSYEITLPASDPALMALFAGSTTLSTEKDLTVEEDD